MSVDRLALPEMHGVAPWLHCVVHRDAQAVKGPQAQQIDAGHLAT